MNKNVPLYEGNQIKTCWKEKHQTRVSRWSLHKQEDKHQPRTMNPVFWCSLFNVWPLSLNNQCRQPLMRYGRCPSRHSPSQGFSGFHQAGLAFIMKLEPADFDGDAVFFLQRRCLWPCSVCDSGFLLQLPMWSCCFWTIPYPPLPKYILLSGFSWVQHAL